MSDNEIALFGQVPAVFDTLSLKREGIVKLPLIVYQAMADIAAARHIPVIDRQASMLNLLKEWVKDAFPGFKLNAFIDLKQSNVEKLKNRGVEGLSWGMYIQLVLDNDLLLKSVEPVVPASRVYLMEGINSYLEKF